MAMTVGALAVAGNHDIQILRLHRLWKQQGRLDPSNTYARIAMEMPDDCIEYIANLPHVLHIPQFNVVAVHAGFVPGKRIEDHTIVEVVHVSYIEQRSGEGGPFSMCNKKTSGGIPWAKMWSSTDQQIALFGHDEHDEVQVYRTSPDRCPHAYGLDTGSWKGGNLSGIIFPGAELITVSGAKPQLSAMTQTEQLPSSPLAINPIILGKSSPPHKLAERLANWRCTGCGDAIDNHNSIISSNFKKFQIHQNFTDSSLNLYISTIDAATHAKRRHRRYSGGATSFNRR